jgi:ADP-ribose pyrophosphatase YjhB (NUDIX family)
MNFCSACGAEVRLTVPNADNRERHVCTKCSTIHYINPKIVTGCIVEWEDQILLCKRAIEPRYGLWTLPAGYMEIGESTLQAARRETLEEANATVEIVDLYMVINLPYVNQVYMMYRSRMLEKQFSSGPESLEVNLYREHEIPWDLLAFPAIRETLRYYYQDKNTGQFRIRTGEINRDSNGYSFHLHT